MQVVTHCMLQNGYRVVVFNHTGALRDTPLTGARLFTYGEKYCLRRWSVNYFNDEDMTRLPWLINDVITMVN